MDRLLALTLDGSAALGGASGNASPPSCTASLRAPLHPSIFGCRSPSHAGPHDDCLSNNAGHGGNISAANLSGLDGPCGGKDWEKLRTRDPRRQREAQPPTA